MHVAISFTYLYVYTADIHFSRSTASNKKCIIVLSQRVLRLRISFSLFIPTQCNYVCALRTLLLYYTLNNRTSELLAMAAI